MRHKDGEPLLDADGQPLYGQQVLDTQALRGILAAWDPATPLLVDREHWSMDQQRADSAAMAWVVELELRADGLWGLLRWTDIGYAEVVNRRLRWLSPVWDLLEDGRPEKLLSVGLTNTARFKDALAPVVNKADPPETTPQPPPPGLAGNSTTKDPTDMEKFITLLGLPEDATEEDVLAAIQALLTERAEAEAAALNSEAEEAAEENEDIIQNKADFIALYRQYPEAARAMLRTLQRNKPQAEPPVTNRAEARRPSFLDAATGGASAVKNKLEIFREMPEGAAKDAYQREHGAELLALERSTTAAAQ
ncbi:MAG: phage protease [Porticoccaceae bacterium]|nr:phage protease [Porticoccaceae bacterium]